MQGRARRVFGLDCGSGQNGEMKLAKSGSSGQSILVVDDDAMVAETVRRALAVDGHSVVVVNGGSEALQAFEVSKFDLVITDFEMPGMKGDELAAELRARVPTQKILMLTAHKER